MDYEDDNYSTDSSEARERDAKKAIVEVVEEEETIPVPGYTEDELNRMLLNIQQIVTYHDLSEEDISESFTENATKWLMDVMETTLFVYFDQGYLSASAGCPSTPVTQLTYFIREEPMHVFTLEGFHDEVTFGQFHENVEETILYLMNIIYAPLILNDSRWDENVKMKLFNELHSFMANLTDVNSKLGSMVILYVPNEGHELSVEEAVLDKALVKRYENVLIYWISQIRLCLNDMDNVMHDLACPSDEYDFWVYKFEVLSGIDQQLCHKNIEHILKILSKSQSLFIVKFKTLCEELTKEIEKSKSNARYLTLLIEPCQELEASEYPKDVPPKLPNIIYLIRVISLNSEYYKNKKNTERLFSYLSNEIIKYCKTKVEVSKILNGHPRFGIKICDMSIDCCLAYKLIFKRVLERLQTEDFRKTWLFDHNQIFNQIDIFIQRLTDIMEICETIIVFGRCDETVTIPALRFGCYNAAEFTMTCQDMEKKFENGLKAIKTSSFMILNVHDKDWYQVMSAFKKLIRSLEEIVHNLLVNVFISINNVEEALDVLTTMHNFSKRKSLQAEYTHKVEEMWTMFEMEVVSVNKDITRLDKEHLGILPKFAGKSMILHIKMKKCERLMNLLATAHYLPKVGAEAKLKMFEIAMENIRKKIEDYNNEWSLQINPQPLGSLSRFLINRSPTHGGLIECNIDRNVLPIFEEAKYFDFMELPLPASLIQMNPKAAKIISIFNKVVNVILLHNKILCSLSDKERLLFKEHIKSMDKKLSPGMFRLTYSDELTDGYISECLKHLNELQHFVDIYKTINMVTVSSFEKISNGLIVNMNIKSIGTLSQFKNMFKESKNESTFEIIQIYKKIIEYIIVIYEGFESQLSTDIAEKWMKYVRKIDALAEYAILNLAKNTLSGVFTLLNGRNDMKPDPFIAIDITLRDRCIEFEPPLENVTRFLGKIYPQIIKSVSHFPRFNEKFELPPTPKIKKFNEVVDEDKECQMFLIKIRQAIEENLEKTSDYLDTWNLFQPIWGIDIERFMAMYQEKGMKLKDFENSMSKYFDVANQVILQDTTVTVTFLTYNCSKLKENVLEYIALWKKGYKQTLCSETLKKLEKHSEALRTRINKLNEQPTCYSELEEALQLHEQSMKELKDRETDMAIIKEFYGFLVKYDIDIPLTIRKNFEAMPADWSWYQKSLREIDDNLYSQKEQFKMGLMTSIRKLQTEVDEVDEKLDELSTSTSITIAERVEILTKLDKRIRECERLEKAFIKQIKLYDLPEISFFMEPLQQKLRQLMTALNVIVNWEREKEDNIVLPIKKIRFENFERLVASHAEKINDAMRLCQRDKWKFLRDAQGDVEFFKANLTFFKNLQSKELEPRHWIKIRKVIGKDFDEKAKEFSMKKILEMKFLDFLSPIQDILYSAFLESKVEKNLKTIVKLWMTLKHDLKFKDEDLTTKVIEDCRAAFEDHAQLMSDVKIEHLVDTSSGLFNAREVKQSFISELLAIVQENSDAMFQGEEDKTGQVAMSMKEILDDLHDILHSTALKTSAGKPQTRYHEQSKLMKAIENLLTTLKSIIQLYETKTM